MLKARLTESSRKQRLARCRYITRTLLHTHPLNSFGFWPRINQTCLMAQIAVGWPYAYAIATGNVKQFGAELTSDRYDKFADADSPTSDDRTEREQPTGRLRHRGPVPSQRKMLAASEHVQTADSQRVLRRSVDVPTQVLDVVDVAGRLGDERAVAENLQIEIAQRLAARKKLSPASITPSTPPSVRPTWRYQVSVAVERAAEDQVRIDL